MSKKAVEYDEVYIFLSRKYSRYVPNCLENRKRVIRRFSKKIVLEDGHLFYVKVEQNQERKKWIRERQVQQQALESAHVSGDCHFDRVKTKENLDSEPVFWPSIQSDIVDYIKRCEECQKATPKLMKSAKRECISASATAPPGTEVAAKEHTSTDSTLTVDNLLRVMKKVTSDVEKVWESVLEWDEYDFVPESYEVESKYTTARKKTNDLADVYVNSHPEPSWKHVIRTLFKNVELAAAKEAESFLQQNEPVQCSLTIDNIVMVMEKVTSDEERRSIWSNFFLLIYKLLEMVDKKHTTEKEKTTALAGVYIYDDNDFSWEDLAECLYTRAEMAAAKVARSFLEKNDSTLTVDNLVRVMKKVTSDERVVWEEVLKLGYYVSEPYLDEVESKYPTAREKTNVLADVYVNSHPKPSWEHIIESLYCCDEMAAAKEAKSFLQNNYSTLTVDNLVRVMEKVTPDEGLVWCKVLLWKDNFNMEYIPFSYIDEVYTKCTTEKEKTNDLAYVYIYSHPDSSWEHLVKTLKQNGEQAAAEEAESFLHQNDATSTCTSDSLSKDGSSQAQTSQLGTPSTSGYFKIASDQPGGSSEDPSIPPPAKYRKISIPLSNGGASKEASNSEERLAPTTDCKLTIRNLKILRSASNCGEKINVIKRLTLDRKWIDLGDLLAFDDSSSKLDDIQRMFPNDPEACCRAMFQHWIEGNGVQPCTWSKLIELLRDCDQEELANEIEATLTV